jgi:hypothetical protein
LGQDQIIDEIKNSGLRGRGGAGFPTGMKWGFMPKEPKPGKPNFLVINAGRIRARILQGPRDHPPRSAQADRRRADRRLCDAGAGRLHLHPGEFIREAETLFAAVSRPMTRAFSGKNAAGSGWDFDLFVHRGAGAYICGEETAMLNSLEGKKGFPRLKPPFPAGAGLYGCPTTVNNVESIAVVPTILRRGAAWFKSFGPREERRHQALPDLRPCEQAVRGRGSDVDPVPRADRPPRRRHPRRLGQSASGDPRRLLGPARARGADHGRADGFRRASRSRLRPRHGRRHRDGQVDGHRQSHQPHLLFLQA